jgi:opacity protein-like surface antigen
MRIIPAIMFSLLALSALPAAGQVERGSGKVETDTSGSSEDLMSLLEDDESTAPKAKDHTTATFKTTRIINGHSVEMTGKGVLDFRISHRFGEINDGAREFFGLDNANTRIGFDYGVTDWLSIGIGRSSFDKEYDGFLKARVLRQGENGGMPFTLNYVGAMSITDMPAPALPAGQEWHFSNRMYFANQLLIARKFSQAFSLQLMPTHVHWNLVDSAAEPNSMFSLGAGGRLKLSNRISLNLEYYYVLGEKLNNARNSLSVGFDIETGGHVFQLMLTNSISMTERHFIAGQSNSDIGDGGIHFGFNISRVFTIVRPKEFANSRNKIW